MLRLIERFEKEQFITLTVILGGVAIWGRAKLDEVAETLVYTEATMFLPSGMVSRSEDVVVPLDKIDAWHGKAFQVFTAAGKRIDVTLI
jgi:hypothetical protein